MNPPDLLTLTADDLRLDTDDRRSEMAKRLNWFFEQTTVLFSGNITVGANVSGAVYALTFTTSATYVSADDFAPINLLWSSGRTVVGVFLGYLKKSSEPQTVLKTALNVDWTQTSAKNLRVNFIAGLDDSTRYQATVLVL